MVSRAVLEISAGCGPLRARLGPAAWMVLEELLLRADPSGRVGDGVRAMGAGLGLDKDTAARALRRLRDVGLVERTAPVGYQVRLSACNGLILATPHGRTGGRPHDGDSGRVEQRRAVSHRDARPVPAVGRSASASRQETLFDPAAGGG
ncbi:MAG: hypothetical protein ACRDZY_02750 [Acidimicrobiales bacterium]